MERHWATKVKVCPYARQLGLEEAEPRCDLKDDLQVRRWSVLEFAANRRVELDIVEGKGKTKKVRSAPRTPYSLSARYIPKKITKIPAIPGTENPGTRKASITSRIKPQATRRMMVRISMAGSG